MAGAVPLIPQVEEQNIFAFDRSEDAVAFFLDICKEDLELLKKYYERSLKNVLMMRMQNTMRVRQNDKYLTNLEEEIARIENRWVVPLAKATNIFESATKYTDTPPQDVKAEGDETVEIAPVTDTDIQSRERWADVPAVVQLKALGVRPYREAMKKLRELRHRRSQYKYLEIYFLNIARTTINLQNNLTLVMTVIDKVLEVRGQLGDKELASNPLGIIVKQIVASSDLETAIERIKEVEVDKILGKAGEGGPPKLDDKSRSTRNSEIAKAAAANVTKARRDSGIQSARSGDIPNKSSSRPNVGRTFLPGR